MNQDFRSVIAHELYSDLRRTSSSFGSLLLAHYTTLESFEKIVTSNELWFSHPFLMNDREEVRYGLNEGTRAIMEDGGLRTVLQGDKYRIFVESFQYWRAHYDQNYVFDTYVFCLSKHQSTDDDGRLSMWRGYGGDGAGVAVIFDPSKLRSDVTSPILLDEISYATSKERQSWLKNFLLTKLINIIYQFDLPQIDLPELSKIVFERLTLASIFSKHRGFDEEQEVRAVYMPERDKTKRFAPFLHYHNGTRGIEPKLKLKLDGSNGILAYDISLERLVHHIILGPSRSSPLVYGATVRMLQKAGRFELASTLKQSSIPYRAIA